NRSSRTSMSGRSVMAAPGGRRTRFPLLCLAHAPSTIVAFVATSTEAAREGARSHQTDRGGWLVPRPHPWQPSPFPSPHQTGYSNCGGEAVDRCPARHASQHFSASRPERGRIMTRRFAVVYERGPSSFGAYLPDLPGCVAVGKTREEVEQLIQ